ncbi:MAG: fused MFS/spermidine synthase, partial [Chloroflexi bacterium]|nr:fused MFS/spermidine synthase [Chloroflexota bacterium]
RIIWLVAAILLVMGIIAWFSWRIPDRWHLSLKNFIIWMILIEIVLTAIFLSQFRESWQKDYTRESNYFTIQVVQGDVNVKVLVIDHLIHSYVRPGEPTFLLYDYTRVFAEIVKYIIREDPAPRVLHLGGGGYVFPRSMEAVYPESVNEVVEIDPAVTQVAHEELGLPLDTSIRTYNQDARLFLIQRKSGEKYNIVIGDVFNDRSTPFHLTTLEFNKLIKANMAKDGIYLVNIIDDYEQGRYLPAFINTLRHAFNYVYLFNTRENEKNAAASTFVIAATDHRINLTDYTKFITEDGKGNITGNPQDGNKLEEYLAAREPILLTDDYAPTDILVASLFR